MTMDYKDRQSVTESPSTLVSFQDTLKAEGVSDSFWLVLGTEPVMICYFPINYEKSVNHTDWVEIPLREILHNQPEALEKVRAARTSKAMKTYLQFRDYLERRGLIYVHNPIQDSYIIYDNSRSVKPLLITETSARDARHNFDRAKDQIEMTMILFGQ